ncbi:hypothetical protein ACWDR9_08825, partial [Streptosporangium sandarakinum]
MTAVELTAEGRSATEVLTWSRRMVESVIRPAAGGLPPSMRHIAGYHFGWWDEHGGPVEARRRREVLGQVPLQDRPGHQELHR